VSKVNWVFLESTRGEKTWKTKGKGGSPGRGLHGFKDRGRREGLFVAQMGGLSGGTRPGDGAEGEILHRRYLGCTIKVKEQWRQRRPTLF